MSSINEIKTLRRSNDQTGIYTIFAPIETLQQREKWIDVKLLSGVCFAGGMLAKISTNEILKRDPDKKGFLEQKSNSAVWKQIQVPIEGKHIRRYRVEEK